MEIDYKAIGRRVKSARIKMGMTQEFLSYLIDVTPAHMSNIETGKTKVSLPTLIAIANALSISVDTLLCDNVLNTKIIFEGEAKEIFRDCDEYEIRLLVEILKAAKEAMRREKIIRNRFKMWNIISFINIFKLKRSNLSFLVVNDNRRF